MRALIDANLLIYLNTVRDPVNKRLYRNFYENIISEHRCYTDALHISTMQQNNISQ